MTRSKNKPVNNPEACVFVSMEGLMPEAMSSWEKTYWAIFISTVIITTFDLTYGLMNNLFDKSQSTETFLFYNSMLGLFFIPLCIVTAIALPSRSQRNTLVKITVFWIVTLFACSYGVTTINL